MNDTRRCNYIANSFYNKGLELACQRDMSGACEALKKALRFNKRHVDARNLLGLIYFEIGEISEAMVQWVLSLNIQPVGNLSDRYLGELQRQDGYIESWSQAISKFNQCLAMAQGGSDDLATIQLIKITGTHKKYLKAHLLLGLLYYANEDYPKAYHSMQDALRIDRGNSLAIRCIEDIRSLPKENNKDKSKKALQTVLTPGKAKSSEDYIIPERYRENTGWQTFVNIFVGILIGTAAVIFLYLPAKEKSIAAQYNNEVISIAEKLESMKSDNNALQETIASMEDEYDALNKVKENIAGGYEAKLAALQELMGAVRYFQDDDIINAAKLLAQVDGSLIEDIDDGSGISPVAYYKELTDYYNGDGYVRLTGMGDGYYSLEDYDTAMDMYDLSIAVHPDNPVAMYKKGLCYIKKGDRDTANELFTEIIENWPDGETAHMAKLERGY